MRSVNAAIGNSARFSSSFQPGSADEEPSSFCRSNALLASIGSSHSSIRVSLKRAGQDGTCHPRPIFPIPFKGREKKQQQTEVGRVVVFLLMQESINKFSASQEVIK